MKKSLTLIELVIAIVFIGVVLLAAGSVYIGSQLFYTSSDHKTQVVNELMFVLDHMRKYGSQAHGWVDDPGFAPLDGANLQLVPNTPSLRIRWDEDDTPADFAGDEWVEYIYVDGQLLFCQPTPGGTDGGCNAADENVEVLSHRVTSCTFRSVASGTAVEVSLKAQFDPASTHDPKTNPTAEIRSTIPFLAHSFN